jgi:hypothetical protein
MKYKVGKVTLLEGIEINVLYMLSLTSFQSKGCKQNMLDTL